MADVGRMEFLMADKPRILLIGLNPDRMNFATSGGPPGVTADVVHMAIAAGNARLNEKGIPFDMLLLAPGETSDDAVVKQLAQVSYACIVIGGGLRKPDDQVKALEMVINAVRAHAPNANIAFNTNPTDSADAAMRWL